MIQILKDKQSMYTINTSLHESPVVISLPHSGTYITSEMAENLMDDVIFPNTDWYLPKLYGFFKRIRFTIIINNMNRHLIDVNRDINDKKVVLIRQI
ncbi:MAG: N-formylglutamate amidohydrolase [Thomasclavelia spiroformis]